MVETTLVLLKPDCLAAKHCGDVIKRFEQAGLEIVGCKMMLLSEALLARHYSHVADKPFYPGLREFMQSSPVIVLALSGEGAILRARELMGPTDSRKAAKGTIRGDYGKDSMFNVVHGSDSRENAAAELKRFFSDLELNGNFADLMTLQAIVFDFDGLIVDTEGPGFVSWSELYDEFGQKLTLDDWRHATGYVGGFDPGLHLEKLLGHKLDWSVYAPRRESRNWELTLQQSTLAGIKRLMVDAHNRSIKIGVASNSGFGWVDQGLERLGLRHFIETIVTRDMVLNPKPAPDAYLKAAQALQADPHYSVAVEDSEPGSRAAKAAGMRVVAIPNQFSERQDLSIADLIVPSAEDLSIERLVELVLNR